MAFCVEDETLLRLLEVRCERLVVLVSDVFDHFLERLVICGNPEDFLNVM